MAQRLFPFEEGIKEIAVDINISQEKLKILSCLHTYTDIHFIIQSLLKIMMDMDKVLL